MKIIFDLDGTLTDFNYFIEKNAIPFFKKNYNMEVIYPDALEIEEIFDIENKLHKQGLSDTEAKRKMDEMLNHFWIGLNFVKFTLLCRFRENASKYIKKLIKQGHSVEIYTSRDKTCQKNFVGFIARFFTYLQCMLNGISIRKCRISFFSDDKQKMKKIVEVRPDLVFEDKAENLNHLNKNRILAICVSGRHNKDIVSDSKIPATEEFDCNKISQILERSFGKKKYQYMMREAFGENLWRKIKLIEPLFFYLFKVKVLNGDKMIKNPEEGIIYASNHRSTLDPVVIIATVRENIHYAALKRFFDGKDSIFNNNKNLFLCKFTAWLFNGLAFFPIERKSDNPSANNIEAIRDMNYCLYLEFFPK